MDRSDNLWKISHSRSVKIKIRQLAGRGQLSPVKKNDEKKNIIRSGKRNKFENFPSQQE